MREQYQGKPVWLVCGGPSVRGFDFSRLSGTVAAINEIGIDVPNLDVWIGNDALPDYPPAFWSTPCLKFVRLEQGTLPASNIRNLQRFRSCSQNITGSSVKIKERIFFGEDSVLWGGPAFTTDGKLVIKKSAMLMAFGVLYRMGFSEVRLLGCDWSQSLENPYGHEHKPVDETAVRKSNEQFGFLEQWFETLLPMFEQRGFRIVNCTDGGRLELFERRDWRELCAKEKPAPAMTAGTGGE